MTTKIAIGIFWLALFVALFVWVCTSDTAKWNNYFEKPVTLGQGILIGLAVYAGLREKISEAAKK
jgi:hypothetical protein